MGTAMTAADSVRVRRATLRLGLLAAALLVAGLLPWLTGAPLAVRLLALPLLLTGVGIAAVAARIRSVLAAPVPPQPSAAFVERRCDGCACGGGGCAVSAAEPAPKPAPKSAPEQPPAADAGPGAPALDRTAG